MKKRIIFLVCFMLILLFPGCVFALTIDSVNLTPELDFTRFAPYNVTANITNTSVLNSVQVNISGINGEGCVFWDFYVNGSCASEILNFEMNYSASEGLWKKTNIFPDYIYPEIFFAPSEIAWYNEPSEIETWRRNYHLFNFTNSFEMVENMSFWIEFNALATNDRNSNQLFVYVVGNGSNQIDLDYFESDWRNKENTELVATFSRDDVFHHHHGGNDTDPGNSSHKLVTLSTNSDGTIGSKGLNLSEFFWVVLYQDSVNINRGWNLRYQDSSLCENQNAWFIGDRSGGGTWNTPLWQNGCPDVHIHIARDNNETRDGINITVIVSNETDTDLFSEAFYFGEITNLPPTPTSFITPVVGGVYNDSINITWNPSSDPNNDVITYNISLLNSSGGFNQTLNVTEELFFFWDLANISDGKYGLRIEICDQEALCVNSTLGGNFTIERVEDLDSLLEISIVSNNSRSYNLARAGDLVNLRFVSTGNLNNPSVEFFSGGHPVNNNVTLINDSIEYNATYIVNSSDSDGEKTFIISADNLNQTYTYSTDGSIVLVDNSGPTISLISPVNNSFILSNSINFTFNVTDLIAIDYCNLTLNGEFKGSLQNASRNSTNGIFVSSLSPGFYNWTIYCVDYIENEGTSEVLTFEIFEEEELVEEETTSRFSGYVPQMYYSDEKLPTEGNNFELRFNDKIKFTVRKTNHTLTMMQFNATHARVKIESEPMIVWLEKDVLYEFDLDNDSEMDVRVRYDGRDNFNRAKVFIQEIVYASEEESLITGEVVGDVEEDERFNWAFWLMLLLLILIVVGVVWYMVGISIRGKNLIKRTIKNR